MSTPSTCTGFGAALLAIERSASAALTFVIAEALLFEESGSEVAADTVAELVMAPVTAGADTVIVIAEAEPIARLELRDGLLGAQVVAREVDLAEVRAREGIASLHAIEKRLPGA